MPVHIAVLPRAVQEVQGLLRDTQAAFKLLMETVREKEAAAEELEGQADGLRGAAEALRRTCGELEGALQVREGPASGAARPTLPPWHPVVRRC